MIRSGRKPIIGYMCSYVPHRFISELGFSVISLNDLNEEIEKSTTRLPVNLCSYALHCVKVLDQAGIDGLIITNCCNSMQRLYDYIKLTKPDMFCYMLELPRDNKKSECMYFGNHVTDLAKKLKCFFSIGQRLPVISEDNLSCEEKNKNEIYVLGNAIPVTIRKQMEYLFNDYTLEIYHCRMRNNGDILWQKYLDYKTDKAPVEEINSEIPCARMNYFIDWFKGYVKDNNQLKGVVYFSSQNCDNYLLSFPVIQEVCKANGVPVIQLEVNYNEKSSGQFATRLEAFIECLEFNSTRSIFKDTLKEADENNPFIQRMKLTRALIPKLPLKAIQMVVENQIDIFTNSIWKNPEKTVWTNMVMTPELFYAAGLIPVNMELVAGWLSSLHLSRNYISHSEGRGLSPSICSYHKATLGLIEDGGLSRPLGAAVSSHICDGGVGVANYFKACGTDTFVLNVPFDRKTINKNYLVEQYRSLVTWIENYTGEKLEDNKIRKLLELSNKTRELWLKVLELRKGDPVVPGRFMLRNLFGATFLFGSQFGYEVVKTYHDEMLERCEKAKENKTSNEHKRILWIHFAPLYNNNLLEYLEEELGCYIVYDITGHIYWLEYDIQKPLESLAERASSHFYLGEAEERNQLYAQIIRDYNIDGVIHMMHNGCRAIPGASWQVRDVADQLNVPYLELSGDCIDPRGFSEGQMKLRLEAFKETVWRK